MNDRRTQGTDPAGTRGAEPPVAKDLPDQQPREDEDPLDVPVPKRVLEQAPDAKDVPEPDESGAGRTEGGPAGHESHGASDETPG